MELKEMIEVLQAYARGEKVQVRDNLGEWEDVVCELKFDLPMNRYRIAPKKEMTLVEEAHKRAMAFNTAEADTDLLTRLADRIEELEQRMLFPVQITTDELLAEIARRVK